MKEKQVVDGSTSGADQVDLENVALPQVFEALDTSAEGLSAAEAETRLARYGRNELTDREVGKWERFLRFFWGPIAWMIEAAAFLSLLMGHWADLAIILVLLLYNAISGFVQENKAADALAALKAGLAPKAMVKRDGTFTELDAAELVPGDVIRIKMGEVVPADVRFIDGDFISIDQAALTGESLPVTKEVGDAGYSGSIAKQGIMTAIVTATGGNTFFGRTASLVAGAGGEASHSQKATTMIGDFLVIVCVALCVVLAAFELYQQIVVQGVWHWSMLADLTRMILVLLIASIPVAMPTVITITNSLGAQALAKNKAIVSRLEAIEELAGVDVLCSDKTGTLTQNILTLGEPVLFAAGSAQELILAAALAAERERMDAIDKAVNGGLEDESVLDGYTMEKFVPFDPVGKRVEATLKAPDGTTLMATKGAPQVIIDLCHLEAEAAEKAGKVVTDLAETGFRALGVAESRDGGASWTFLGILSLLDPPREDSKETIRLARERGLRVKMITGDDVAIGSQIASQLGMGTHLIAAADFFTKDMDMDHLSDHTEECVDRADGFGRVFPEHKYGIVKALQHRGHMVAMTGDGVNDAPALKQADCGIAVSGATDAARAAAALVLTAPGLSTVVDAIDGARQIFERIINYVLFRVAMTLDIMFVVVLATVFFGFSPLTPVMIILIALLDDIPIMTIAYDNTPLPPKPVRWQMRRLLLVSSFMGLMAVAQTFGLMIIVHGWMQDPALQAWITLNTDQLQTIIFLQIVAGGHLLLFVMRSRGSMFKPPWCAMPLALAIIGTQIVAVLVCGFGWFVPAIPWTAIGLVWVYMLVWMLVLDVVKLALYRRLKKADE